MYIIGEIRGDVDLLMNEIESMEVPHGSNIILNGDSHLNYYLDGQDEVYKEELTALPYTFLIVYGNEEAHPSTVTSYRKLSGQGEGAGDIYVEDAYPNLLFLDNGIHMIEDKRVLIVGGAAPWVNLVLGYKASNFWSDSTALEPSERAALTDRVRGKDVDIVVSHTCPFLSIPLASNEKAAAIEEGIDTTMEVFLERLRQSYITHKVWFASHWERDVDWEDAVGTIHFVNSKMRKVILP